MVTGRGPVEILLRTGSGSKPAIHSDPFNSMDHDDLLLLLLDLHFYIIIFVYCLPQMRQHRRNLPTHSLHTTNIS